MKTTIHSRIGLRPRQYRCIMICLVLLPALFAAAVHGRANTMSDWKLLWEPSTATLPSPVKVPVGNLTGLGQDLENQEWLMIQTTFHQLFFKNSADPKKAANLARLLDGLYVFLDGRSPTKPEPPIRAFLVPAERGRSRCSPTSQAMRTGELGELAFLLTGLLHEETHLFNFAYLGEHAQGWWSGEFCCLYYQERARLEEAGQDLKNVIKAKLPQGPVAPLAELDRHGKNAFDEAMAAQFFFEEKYGREAMLDFRRECLIASKSR